MDYLTDNTLAPHTYPPVYNISGEGYLLLPLSEDGIGLKFSTCAYIVASESDRL